MANPKPFSLARIHYRKDIAPLMPHHGKTGRIVVVSKGRPRNHGVELQDGTIVCVPCGNLNRIVEE